MKILVSLFILLSTYRFAQSDSGSGGSSGGAADLYLGWKMGLQEERFVLPPVIDSNWNKFFPDQRMKTLTFGLFARGDHFEIRGILGISREFFQGTVQSATQTYTNQLFLIFTGQVVVAYHTNPFAFIDPYLLAKIGGGALLQSNLNKAAGGFEASGWLTGFGAGIDFNLITHKKFGITIGGEVFTTIPFEWTNSGSDFNSMFYGYAVHAQIGLDPETMLTFMLIRAISGRK